MTNTTRLALDKPADDGSDLVNVQNDINAAYDKIDAAVGFQVVTSSTRPSSPYSGKPIAESDTAYRSYFHNGTSPASGGWVQIPNASSTFNADLDLTSGKQINIGSSGSSASFAALNAATGTDLLSGRVSGDTADRFLIDTDGTCNWGPGGSGAPDTNLYRSAANTLKTDDALTVGGALTVTGAFSGASNLATGAWTTYTPTWGAETGTAPVIGNGTITGRYQRIGRTIHYLIEIVTGSTTTYGSGGGSGNYYFSLPAAPAAAWDGKRGPQAVWRDESAAANYSGYGFVTTANHANGSIYHFTVGDGTASAAYWDSVAPFTMAQSDTMSFYGTYEAAA